MTERMEFGVGVGIVLPEVLRGTYTRRLLVRSYGVPIVLQSRSSSYCSGFFYDFHFLTIVSDGHFGLPRQYEGK